MDETQMDTPQATVAPEGQTLRPGEAWVHPLPAGEVRSRSGRLFRVERTEDIVRRSMTGADLPVDYEHEMDDPERARPGPVPAAGWIAELDVREGSVWGRVRWTDEAARLVAARQYRYLSPVVLRTPQGEVTRILGAGLVHRPDLNLLALSAEPTPEAEEEPRWRPNWRASRAPRPWRPTPGPTPSWPSAARRARRPASPTPRATCPWTRCASCCASAPTTWPGWTRWRPSPAWRRPWTRATSTPAMRPWAVALCRQDPAAFDGFLASAAPAYAHLARPHPFPAVPGPEGALRQAASEAEAAICRQLGLERLA